jgi:hypothetical protein
MRRHFWPASTLLAAFIVASCVVGPTRPKSDTPVAPTPASTALPQTPVQTAIPPTSVSVRSAPVPSPAPTTAEYTPPWVEGVPAISPAQPPSDPNTPAITRAQIEDYVRTHGVDGKIDSSAPNTVETVECMYGAPMRQRYGQSYGQPDDRLLCLAIVRGQFTVWGPAVASAGRTPVPAQQGTIARMLFDARTGNILVSGCCR